MPTPSGRVFKDEVVFAGGRLCLDFVNTACEIRGAPLEFLPNTEALNRWLQIAENLYRGADRWKAGDDKTLSRAKELRTALRRLIDAVLHQTPPSSNDIEFVNAVLRADPSYAQLEVTPHGFSYEMRRGLDRDPWLSEIARDAVDLLCNGDLDLLRQCECETCVRVFYDTTKNHRRRWCVEKCGSRVKAANYYRRKREAARSN